MNSRPARHYAAGMPPTQRQIDFINGLKLEREVPEELIESYRSVWRSGLFTAKIASSFIAEMTAYPTRPGVVRKNVAVEGVHNVNGQIIKVQRSQNSGYLYAKVLTQELTGKWSFTHMPGGLKLVSEATKLTLADAKKYGALYGTCCVCGRTLTDEKSIAAGIGPVCAERF